MEKEPGFSSEKVKEGAWARASTTEPLSFASPTSALTESVALPLPFSASNLLTRVALNISLNYGTDDYCCNTM